MGHVLGGYCDTMTHAAVEHETTKLYLVWRCLCSAVNIVPLGTGQTPTFGRCVEDGGPTAVE